MFINDTKKHQTKIKLFCLALKIAASFFVDKNLNPLEIVNTSGDLRKSTNYLTRV